MQQYILRRLLLLIPTMFGITLTVFMAVRFLPGDVVDQLAGDFGAASPEYRKSIEERYSLNDNMFSQYVDWLGELARGDLGTSIISGRPVTSELENRMPATLQLGIMGLVIGLLIALPVGVISAIRQDTYVDHFSRTFAILLLATPSFWIALMAITYGFIWFGWTPPLRYHQLWEDPAANFATLWVPAVILGTHSSGTVMRLTRSTMLEVLRQDYVRTAAAKGLRERVVVTRHALRNAIIPVITVIGLQIPALIGGTVVLERIFSIPGMGSYLFGSIQQRDYPVVQSIVLISAFVVLMTNLIVDVTYSLIDPRIRTR